MPDSHLIATSLKGMVGPNISVAVATISEASAKLFPEEEAAISRATPPRHAEFQAGRQAAREALAQAGAAPGPIPMQPDRAPLWPAGFTGAISHTAGLALAIAAPSPPIKALGLDLEPDIPLECALWPDILTKTEQNWLNTQPENRQGHLAKQLFCIKEACYKAQYTLSRTLLEFTALSIRLDPVAGSFSAEFQNDCPPFNKGEALAGRVAIADGLILASLAL